MAFFPKEKRPFVTNDEYETPVDLLRLVLDKLDREKDFLWEPFPGSGHSTRFIKSRGFLVTNGPCADDFFQADSVPCPPRPGMRTILLSNPPYSTKSDVFKHIARIGAPHVALLMPGAVLATQYFHGFIKSHPAVGQADLQLLVPTWRVRFLDPATHQPLSGRKDNRAPFDVYWFCLGLGLPQSIQVAMREELASEDPAAVALSDDSSSSSK